MTIAIVLLLQCSALAANDAPVEALSSPVSFLSTSDSYEEMEGKADLVVFGTVVDQWTEVRGSSLVITVSEVAIDTKYLGTETATQIEIVQTGGTNGTHTTGVPSNAPLLEDGEEYYLYLEYSPADTMYDAYYLILGGGQGNIPQDEVSNARSNEAVSWVRLQEIVNARFNRRTIIYTTDGPRTWRQNKGTVKFYIDDTYTYEGHSLALPIAFMSKIRTGFYVWNGISNIAYSETYTSGDITVTCDYLGNTGWEGRCDWLYDTELERLHSAIVYINFTTHPIDDEDWDNIIPHEAGHGLGLIHDSDDTLMQEESDDRPTEPTDYDKAALRTIYGNP